MICLKSWKLFHLWTWLLGIMTQYDSMFDLKLTVGHSDLYFMVHCFLKTVSCMKTILRIMTQYDLLFGLRIKQGHSDLYLWSSDFCLIFMINFMELLYTWVYGLGKHCKWPHANFRSVWPIFHDPVILTHIFITISWICIILLIVGKCEKCYSKSLNHEIYRLHWPTVLCVVLLHPR